MSLSTPASWSTHSSCPATCLAVRASSALMSNSRDRVCGVPAMPATKAMAWRRSRRPFTRAKASARLNCWASAANRIRAASRSRSTQSRGGLLTARLISPSMSASLPVKDSSLTANASNSRSPVKSLTVDDLWLSRAKSSAASSSSSRSCFMPDSIVS